MKKRVAILIVSHSFLLVFGFALGIYLLPILTAPKAPDKNFIINESNKAVYKTEFIRDLDRTIKILGTPIKKKFSCEIPFEKSLRRSVYSSSILTGFSSQFTPEDSFSSYSYKNTKQKRPAFHTHQKPFEGELIEGQYKSKDDPQK